MPSLVEIGPKKISSMYSWKRAGPSFEQTWIPFTQGYFVPSLVEIGSVILEEKMKIGKVYDNENNNDNGNNNNWQILITFS